VPYYIETYSEPGDIVPGQRSGLFIASDDDGALYVAQARARVLKTDVDVVRLVTAGPVGSVKLAHIVKADDGA